VFGDFITVGKTILKVQTNRVFDIFYGHFVRVPLAVAALKRRARNKVAIGVIFYDDGKREVFHNRIIGALNVSRQ
jgi:hypothetical protein